MKLIRKYVYIDDVRKIRKYTFWGIPFFVKENYFDRRCIKICGLLIHSKKLQNNLVVSGAGDYKTLLDLNKKASAILWFDHILGGGTETYSFRQIDLLKKENLFIRIQDIGFGNFKLSYFYRDARGVICGKENKIFNFLRTISCNLIVVNNLVGYTHQFDILKEIKKLKDKLKAKVSVRGHDFQYICPLINMVGPQKKYCNITDLGKCEKCVKHFVEYSSQIGKVSDYHNNWYAFLCDVADEIIVFSQSTFDIFVKLYPKIKRKVKIIPHFVPEIRKARIENHKDVNIAVLGNISSIKGSKIVKDMDKSISGYSNVNIYVFGNISEKLKHIKVLGTYDLKDLPDMVEKYNIDIIFIPSIWPETFSYTTSEAIEMGVGVACFNMGAPVERVKCYSRGLIIDEIDGKYALATIVDYILKTRKQ